MKNILKLTAILLILASSFTCSKNDDETTSKLGVIPTSIEQVIDVFELEYGEVKEWGYNNRVFRFSITDLEDNFMYPTVTDANCETSNMLVFLNVETDSRVIQLKVSSKPCSFAYMFDGSTVQNIQYVRDRLESYFSDIQELSWEFGDGTLIENPSLSISLALSYCHLNHGQKDNKSLYKFIFIITKN
jgi:hypothetical protein